MRKLKKIVIGATVAAVSVIAVKKVIVAVDKHRKKWYSFGYDDGNSDGTKAFIHVVAKNAEHAAKVNDIMTKKYNKLSKDYIELENDFNKMLDYYNN